MLKVAFAAALLLTTTGCYMEPAMAQEPPAIEEPFLLEQPEPSIYTGDLEHDRPLVCATKFNENVGMIQMGLPPASPAVERYAVEYLETVEEYQALWQDCEMFDLGIFYYVTINMPPQPLPADEPALGPWDTRFDF